MNGTMPEMTTTTTTTTTMTRRMPRGGSATMTGAVAAQVAMTMNVLTLMPSD